MWVIETQLIITHLNTAETVHSGEFSTTDQYTNREWAREAESVYECVIGNIQALSVAINEGLEQWFVVGDGL